MTSNWNLVGHEWAVDMLRQHVARDEARHAYLFAGPAGLGRRTLALRFAQALNCTQPAAPGEPCGTCRDCKQIETMQHPDLTIVQADAEGKTLRVEQVRALQHSFSLKPYQAKYRVALFLRFQEANANAANALLKTLEEAPSHAVLILTADSPEALLPTIVSRCEVLRLRPSHVDIVESFLKEHGAQAEQARLIAHISGGKAGYAWGLLQDEKLLHARSQRLNDLGSLLPASRVAKFAYAEKLSKDKDAMRQTILLWISYWRDVLLQTTDADTPLANIDRTGEIQSLAARLDLATVRRVVEDLEHALARLERNVNPRLLAEVLLLDWPNLPA